MRRLFIIRKDLHLSPGKLSAMVGHCVEGFWTNLLKHGEIHDNEFKTLPAIDPLHPDKPMLYRSTDLCQKAIEAFYNGEKNFIVDAEDARPTVSVTVEIPKDIWEHYVNGIFKKTICECKNKNRLMKAKMLAEAENLVEGKDFGFINDSCFTELKPENEDGTCTVGIWFKPLPDEIAHKISKKFQLYKVEHV